MFCQDKNTEYYYENGKKRGTITYKENSETLQRGWDDNGVEIPNYIVEQEARFPGGLPGWKKYLEANLDPEVAARAKAPVGIYTIKVQFIVDKEGNIDNVKAITIPAACKKCAKEAINYFLYS